MKKITWKQVLRDALVSAGFLGLAVLISGLLSQLHNDSNPFAPSLFILAVALIAWALTLLVRRAVALQEEADLTV